MDFKLLGPSFEMKSDSFGVIETEAPVSMTIGTSEFADRYTDCWRRGPKMGLGTLQSTLDMAAFANLASDTALERAFFSTVATLSRSE